MNKLDFTSISKGHELSFESSPVFKKDLLKYPVLEIKSFHYTAKVRLIGSYPHADFDIEATLIVSDTRDGVPFEKSASCHEGCDLMDKEDELGEGYVFESGKVDMDELALTILISSLPIRLVREGSSLPRGGKGYRVLSEEEAKKSHKEDLSSRFKALDDVKIEK